MGNDAQRAEAEERARREAAEREQREAEEERERKKSARARKKKEAADAYEKAMAKKKAIRERNTKAQTIIKRAYMQWRYMKYGTIAADRIQKWYLKKMQGFRELAQQAIEEATRERDRRDKELAKGTQAAFEKAQKEKRKKEERVAEKRRKNKEAY